MNIDFFLKLNKVSYMIFFSFNVFGDHTGFSQVGSQSLVVSKGVC
jgi:hypothetical protein